MKLSLPGRSQAFNLRTHGWGLHIAGEDLVFAGISNRLSGVKLLGHGRLENWRSLAEDETPAAFEDWLEEHRLKRGEAFLGLGRNQVMVRFADFPLEAEETIDEVVQYQLESLFPGNFEQFEFFNQIVGRGEALRVMVIAVAKATMGELFAVLNRLQVRVAGITLDSLALANGLSRLLGERFKQQRLVVLQSYQNGVAFLGLVEGRIAASHFIPLPVEGWQGAAVRGLEEGLGQARMDSEQVDEFLLAGNPNPELQAFLQEELGIQFRPVQDHGQQPISPLCLTAMSLALTAVNDAPAFALNALPHALRKRHRRLPVMVGSLLAVLLLLWLGTMEIRSYLGLRHQLRGLSDTNAQLMIRVEEMVGIKQRHESKYLELQAYQPYHHGDAALLKLLATFARELPLHTYLNSVNLRDGKQITMAGESEDPYQVRTHLQSLPAFQNVDFSGPVSPARDKKKKKFTLVATINFEALS
jgi:Tfp pilus assembly protein PilN